MGRNKRQQMEFHFYDIPQSESVRALIGEQWRRVYGHDNKYLHFHNLMEIGICHQGNGVLTIDKRQFSYSSGMISIIPANCPHDLFSEQEDFWEFIYISPVQMMQELYPNRNKIHEEKLAMVNRRAALLGLEEGAALISVIQQIVCEMKRQDDYYRDVVKDLVKIFLLRLLRMNEEISAESALENVSSPQIQPALAYIQEHYSSDMRAEDLARQCGMSEPHFRRVFREYVNMSPIDYLNFVRIREACKMLSRRDCSMDLVAAECGYSSVSTFTRNFKKFLDVTPYQWKLQQERQGSRLRDYSITLHKGWDLK